MIPFHGMSPEIFSISLPWGQKLAIRWYGLMYVIGFFVGFWLLKYRAKKGFLNLSYRACENLVSYYILGMILGARGFYVIFYNPAKYFSHPLEIFMIWEGGLSFHGAAFGMTMASIVFGRKYKIGFLPVADALAYACLPGLFFGRMGNFINGELWGRMTDVPWGMVFPGAEPAGVPRHPSQIYQAVTEGIILFLIVIAFQRWALVKNKLKRGYVGCVFLMGYGSLRFVTEYFRQPDPQFQFGGYSSEASCVRALGTGVKECSNSLGSVLWGLSMGQILCTVMIVLGAGIMFYLSRHQKSFQPKSPQKNFLEAQ